MTVDEEGVRQGSVERHIREGGSRGCRRRLSAMGVRDDPSRRRPRAARASGYCGVLVTGAAAGVAAAGTGAAGIGVAPEPEWPVA